jgi:ABC-type phosphate transport system substrate-binding protein
MLRKLSGRSTDRLPGGGATFPHPIYARWIAEFQKLHPDIEIKKQNLEQITRYADMFSAMGT